MKTKSILKNEQGAVLLKAVAFTTLLAGMAVLLTGRLRDINKKASGQERTFKRASLLSGALAYSKYLIENKKCIDLNTGSSKVDCDQLNDPGALQRLLLYGHTVKDLRSRFEMGVKPLDKLKFSVNRTSISPGHPMYPLFEQFTKASKLEIKYTSNKKASKGKVIDVKVNIKVIDEKNKDLDSASSLLRFTPRQINRYVLALNRGLSIGVGGKSFISNDNDQGRPENVIQHIPKGKMNFRSPVFVNGDFVLPVNASKKVKGSSFLSVVNVGGRILQYGENSGMPFTPEKRGQLLYLNNLESYSGLKGGVKRANYDQALEYLFNKNYDGVVQDDNMIKCIEYSKRKYDEDTTVNSKFIVREMSASADTGEYTYKLGLSDMNEYVSVNADSDSWVKNKHDSITYGSSYDSIPPNLSVTLFGGSSPDPVHFFMGKTYKVEVDAKEAKLVTYDDPTYSAQVQVLEDDIKDIEKQIKDVKTSGKPKADKDTEIAALNVTLADKQAALLKLNTDNTPPSAPILEFSMEPIVGASQRSISLKIKNRSDKWKWTSGMSIGFKVFNLRTKTTNIDSLKYLSFSDSVDIPSTRRAGPNATDEENRRMIPMVDDGKDGVRLTSKLEKRWMIRNEESGSWKFVNYPLRDDEREALGSNPKDWNSICLGINTDEDSNDVFSSYTKSSFHSWNYNPVSRKYQYKPQGNSLVSWDSVFGETPSQLVLNSISVNSSNDKLFHIYSVLDKCVVEKDADYFFGMLVCRHLKIEPRKKPLTIIGSFVVDYLNISKEAIVSGIEWMNIYEFNAIKRMKKIGTISMEEKCEIESDLPPWHPNPKSADIVKAKKCSPFSLARLSDPFAWSSFDPVCGLKTSKSSSTTCKPHDMFDSFFVSTIGEEYE